MAMGSGLLALALVAADGPSSPTGAETTGYQVRVLTLDGLDWRSAAYTRLQPVARQGMSTIWTADRALAASLADRAKASSPCHAITAVGEAVVSKAEAVHYIAAMDRVADGPMNQSSAVAFLPRPEQVEERFAIKVEGRKLDQGVLTRITLEETHVDVIHGVSMTEMLRPAAPKANPGGKEADDQGQTASATSESATTSITSSVQIPEVSHASVSGEWLIPNDGVLLVSLGVKTAADDKGMAVARERVAVIEACSAKSEFREISASRPAAKFEHTRLAQPVAPGRSLPEAFDPAGNLVDLPPLPEALASADLDRIKPEPNQPSPQSPVRSSPSSDPALARTGYDPASPATGLPTSPLSALAGLMGKAVGLLEDAGFVVRVDARPQGAPTARAAVEKFQEQNQLVDAGQAKAKTNEELGDDDEIDLPVLLRALTYAGATIPEGLNLECSHLRRAIADAKKDASTAKADCEKCEGDATFCPANARAMAPAPSPGGMVLAPAGKPEMHVMVRDAGGATVIDQVADLDAVLRTFGKTGTSLVPLGDRFALEIKATVVPATPEQAKAAQAATPAPAARR